MVATLTVTPRGTLPICLSSVGLWLGYNGDTKISDHFEMYQLSLQHCLYYPQRIKLNGATLVFGDTANK